MSAPAKQFISSIYQLLILNKMSPLRHRGGVRALTIDTIVALPTVSVSPQ